ncbi:hypothetical protein G5V58_03980 [Nocardioides anomalus]|uniref:Uncharacterized protein n=1 Tax=Nocardioides anomalus TaxID=2712223 RepID=A0A6G6W9L4_9ACTN|nr:hypothetical protein [Nocardioides anomalus]QIG42041.1 hypothetical protein G5V58_03980 [Nocardioides anomalus]
MFGEVPEGYALVDMPSWAWGGKPQGLFADAGVRCIATDDPGRWLVQTNERYRRQRPDLVQHRELAGPGARRPDFSYLSSRPHFAAHESSAWALEELAAREERVSRTGNPVHAFEAMRLRLLLAEPAALAGQAEHEFTELLQVPLQDQPETKVFADAGAHVFERSASLVWRQKLPLILCQIWQDPLLQVGDIAHVGAAQARNELTFQSAHALADGVYLMDAYIGPLLAALSPSVWAFNVPRMFGSLMFSLGQPVAGGSSGAEEMLHHIGVPGRDSAMPVARLTPTASATASRWWADALNSMFAVTSDFSVFTDAAGVYLPRRHMTTILTVEQLFRRTTSALISERDTNARRVLMFTALDTVERLTTVQLENLTDFEHARAALEAISESLSQEAAEVLVPGAARAVQALEAVQDGFFLRRSLGTVDVELQVGTGVQSMTPRRAAALYLKALRDATHGHGARRGNSEDRTDALLAQHDGVLPHDLGLLAYLYLLEILVRPDRLREVLRAGCRRPRQSREGNIDPDRGR